MHLVAISAAPASSSASSLVNDPYWCPGGTLEDRLSGNENGFRSRGGEEKWPEGKEEGDNDGERDVKEDAEPEAAKPKTPSEEDAGPEPAESGTRNQEAEGSQKMEEEEPNKTNTEEEGGTWYELGWKADGRGVRTRQPHHDPGGARLEKVRSLWYRDTSIKKGGKAAEEIEGKTRP
ncbi:hypothetical protein NDU88_007238 [Pleurodeles waltl]|uniref:Uncharacterized protein n=1 Tax=Pleurodeles waltl TaxID=8319 RepID=A0AAV7M2D3_PLEWA|nr:hypothetical protein NDU88_007238 [Pleurodeles waltl]